MGFIAVELFLAVGGYAAVGRHTHFAIVISEYLFRLLRRRDLPHTPF